MAKRIFTGFLTLCLSTSIAWLSGCGGGDEPPAEDNSSESGAGQTQAAPSDTPVKSASNLQVFFDNPLQIAADQTVVGGSAVETPSGPDGSPVPDGSDGPGTPEPAPTESAASALAWDKLIPAEQVLAGVKNIRNELSRRLVNLGAYNSTSLEIAKFGSALSFLAEVGRQHDGDIGWKEKAHLIRALGQTMVEITGGSTARGKKSYDAVNNAFLTVCEILDGNDPAAPPETDVESGIAEAAEMAYLMQVIERQLEWLQNNAGSEDSFKENAELVAREASMMAAIAEAFNVEDYGYGPGSNDEEFEGYTYGLRDAASEMFKASGTGNFEAYDAARSAAAQKCVECHMVYRNG